MTRRVLTAGAVAGVLMLILAVALSTLLQTSKARAFIEEGVGRTSNSLEPTIPPRILFINDPNPGDGTGYVFVIDSYLNCDGIVLGPNVSVHFAGGWLAGNDRPGTIGILSQSDNVKITGYGLISNFDAAIHSERQFASIRGDAANGGLTIANVRLKGVGVSGNSHVSNVHVVGTAGSAASNPMLSWGSANRFEHNTVRFLHDTDPRSGEKQPNLLHVNHPNPGSDNAYDFVIDTPLNYDGIVLGPNVNVRFAGGSLVGNDRPGSVGLLSLSDGFEVSGYGLVRHFDVGIQSNGRHASIRGNASNGGLTVSNLRTGGIIVAGQALVSNVHVNDVGIGTGTVFGVRGFGGGNRFADNSARNLQGEFIEPGPVDMAQIRDAPGILRINDPDPEDGIDHIFVIDAPLSNNGIILGPNVKVRFAGGSLAGKDTARSVGLLSESDNFEVTGYGRVSNFGIGIYSTGKKASIRGDAANGGLTISDVHTRGVDVEAGSNVSDVLVDGVGDGSDSAWGIIGRSGDIVFTRNSVRGLRGKYESVAYTMGHSGVITACKAASSASNPGWSFGFWGSTGGRYEIADSSFVGFDSAIANAGHVAIARSVVHGLQYAVVNRDERFADKGGNDFKVGRRSRGKTIQGTPGIDHIVGDDGDNTIIGGGGADVLFGGKGSDTFIFSPGVMSIAPDFNQGDSSGGRDRIYLAYHSPTSSIIFDKTRKVLVVDGMDYVYLPGVDDITPADYTFANVSSARLRPAKPAQPPGPPQGAAGDGPKKR